MSRRNPAAVLQLHGLPRGDPTPNGGPVAPRRRQDVLTRRDGATGPSHRPSAPTPVAALQTEGRPFANALHVAAP